MGMMGIFRDAIGRWLHTDARPRWSELGLPDDWQSVTFRSGVLSEEFESEMLHAAPFTTYFLAHTVPTRQERGQRAFGRLKSEQSRKELADEDIGYLRELAPEQHCIFERDPIEWWYHRYSEGDSTAREKVEAFESIITSYPSEKLIRCGEQTHGDCEIRMKPGLTGGGSF